ncbi:hypothetical protein BOTBODRAFT_46403 [Botryobasidium botryosum FD-172 SS1]|uniref:Tafazzin family protein n=1 Tax=Botryobasidium botryosum (strain FD-172 SS1) TaxID=930990 RepID=A0A067M6P1_BOTB1|nr:hypothetical protein BOTBODRAFT_46403 [Botryobasidium botryosum FD-172 SS1]
MSILPSIVLPTIGIFSKLGLYMNYVTVNGLPHLLHALQEGKGVVTVSNHISVVDDPLSWGVLPLSNYFNPDKVRWTLGAHDIMFTNSVHSTFFRAGQVIETFRGQGVHQPAIDEAVRKLEAGKWLHIFPEGKVNQPTKHPSGGLIRFKWGIGRILMDTKTSPTVIPMWISGFDKIMPEPRRLKFIPRLGKRVSITFGDPLQVTTRTQEIVSQFRENRIQPKELAESRQQELDVRIEVTRCLQEEVERLGRSVGGLSPGAWPRV